MHALSNYRVWVLRLAAAALLLNALVPGGFMLHPTAAGGLTFVLCPDQGAMPGYSFDEHSASSSYDEMQALAQISDQNRCAYAVAAAALLPTVAPAVQATAILALLSPVPLDAVIAKPVRNGFSVRGPPPVIS